jgi:3-isopropylmalate/(R)-2-methylmalate dehydratase small subunit
MKSFGGPVLFLNRSDINTDEIIPAKYLTAVSKDDLKPHLLEDLKLDGFEPSSIANKGFRVIVSQANFGCGSSREHAPWALEVNQITMVIAESYARIFRQNMFNGGMMAIELPASDIDSLFALSKSGAVSCTVKLESGKLCFSVDGHETKTISFSLSPFDEALVKAGGWVEYADARY